MFARRQLLAIAAAALLWPTAAGAQGAPSIVETLNRLGPEGIALAARAGRWDVTETAWDGPGATPVTTTGLVAERRMLGPMLQEFLQPAAETSRTSSQSPGTSVRRIDYLTFNRVEGRWDYVSMDLRDPDGIMSAWSLDRDPGERIRMTFQPFAVPGDGVRNEGQMLRMEQIVTRQGPDHDTKDQYFILPDGSGTKWLGHRYAYVRRLR